MEKWKWIAAIVIPVLSVAFYFLLRDNQNTIYLKVNADQINYKYPVDFGALPTFDDDLSDTQYVKFTWDFGDGTIDSSRFVVQHTYSKPGMYPVSVRIRSLNPKLKIAKADTAWQLYVCAPQFELTTRSTDIEIGQVVKFSLQYDSLYPPKRKNTWYLNGEPAWHNSYTFTDSFSNAGTQQIRFAEDEITPGSEACYAKDISLAVVVNSPQTLAIDLSGNTALPQPESHVRSSWLWLMGLLIIIPAAIAAWIKRKLVKKDRESKAKVGAIIEQFTGRESPWEIPFKNHDELVEDEQGISQLSKLYKRRSQAESYYLNIPQTISSTIRSEGLLQPIYSSASRPLEFLILIDKTKVKSQQVKLFEYLVSKFSRNDIYLEKFYFQSTPEICTNANHPNGIHISRLHDLYAGHTLIIFGTGYQFLESHYPALKDSLALYYKKWVSRAICTPVTYTDWNYREKLLQQAGAVFPADLKGQLLLFRVLEQSDLLQDDFKKYIDDAYAVKSYNFSNTGQLARYLNSPFLYQWLCALSVYPHIDWNVMVAIGDALQAKHFRNHAVNYSSLLKLVRISWMVEGTWPDNLRLELLKELEPAHEKTARETMVHILEEAALKVNPSSAVYENVQTQLIINKFLLHAHDQANAQYQQYTLAAEQFKNLWEQEKIMDSTLAEYLRKPAGDVGWPTLINNNELSGDAGESLTIDSYLKDGVHVMKKKLAPAQTSLLVTSLFSVSVLVLLLTMGTSFRDSGIDKLLKLTEADSMVTLLFRIGFNDCFDSSRIQTESTQFVLIFPDESEVVLNADTLSRTVQVPYAWKDNMVNLSVISNNTEYNHDTIFNINSKQLTLGISGCPPPVPSCNRWTADNENAAQFQTRYSGDWYEILTTPDKSSYAPFHIEPGYINGKKVVETYTCPNDENNFKVILDNEDGTFQVAYMRTDQSPDNLSFAFINNRFPSRSAARSDASAPQTVTRQRFGTGAVIAANTLTALQGRWGSEGSPQQTGGFTISIAAGTPTFTSSEIKATIIRAERSQVNAAVTFYKLTMQAQQGRTGSVYIVQLSDSRILLSEGITAPRAGVTRITPSMGIFYPSIRADRSREYTRISIDQLPASLNEIWQGGSSNRFLKINLATKYIHYAVGDPNSASVFGIGEVYRRGNNNYKLLAPLRNGFRVMFLRNVTAQGFEYSFCENSYKPGEVASLDESFCDQFNTMKLYYPSSRQRIYVPVDGKNYESSEAQKQMDLRDLLVPISEGQMFLDSIVIFINRENTDDENRSARINLVKTNSDLRVLSTRWTERSFDGNEFDRDYIIVYTREPIRPNCQVTYNSIDETQKLSSPLLVCRLNLSSRRLSELPKEITTFTNLQYLNLGETTVPDAALNDLRRRFTKLDLQYSRPPTNTEIELLSIVIRSNQFTPESEKIVLDIAGNLVRDQNKKIRIEGDYYSAAQQKLLNTAINNTTDLLYKNKVDRKSGQVIQKLNDRRKEQTSAAGPTLRIIGINFPEPRQSNVPKTN